MLEADQFESLIAAAGMSGRRPIAQNDGAPRQKTPPPARRRARRSPVGIEGPAQADHLSEVGDRRLARRRDEPHEPGQLCRRDVREPAGLLGRQWPPLSCILRFPVDRQDLSAYAAVLRESHYQGEGSGPSRRRVDSEKGVN
jgi:hypothetical protein